MKIIENINEVRRKIRDGNTALGTTIAADGLAAIKKGMKDSSGNVTLEWDRLMRHFAKTPAELDRLCGKEPDFNRSTWGEFCQVYIAGDSTCASDTAMTTGTRRSMSLRDEMNMNRDMQDNLDAEGVDLLKFL